MKDFDLCRGDVDGMPGTHRASAGTMETSVIRLTVRSGETAYLLCTVELSPIAGRPMLLQINAESVATLISGMVFRGQFQPQ